MAARWVGAESTSPCMQVKHLPDLLRNKANSQQYPRVHEDRRPESIEDTEKTDSKGIALGQKRPWDQTRDQGDRRPRPGAHRACHRTPGGEPVNGSLPCQTRFEQHQETPGCLKLQGGESG